MPFRKKNCPDCEPAQVNHFVIRISSYMGLFIKPALKPLDYLTRVVLPPRRFSWFDIVGPRVLKVFAFLHIGKLERELAEHDSDRTRALWTEAKRRGIDMVMYRCGPIKDLFIARYGGKTRCFDGLPRPVGPEAPSLYWMDNKPQMRRRFQAAGIPVANGGSCFGARRALAIFRSLKKPVIVKPYSGSRSRHTTIHLETEAAFLAAFKKAKQLSPLALIEEELEGFVYRGTLIGGKLAAVMRREPPHVVGDGKHSVLELVEMENKRQERSQPKVVDPRFGKTESGHTNTFHPIATGEEAEAELLRQKLDWKSIPEKGRLVMLNQKISRGLGASNSDVTDLIHPENKKLLEKIGDVLKDPLVGVDFIMSDIQKSWKEQPRAGVIECNSLPFIDLHHYPLNGAPRNVAGKLWDIIFPPTTDLPAAQYSAQAGNGPPTTKK